MEFVIYRNCTRNAIEVTFSNTSTDFLAMVYEDKTFQSTEINNNSIVKSSLKSEILVMTVNKKFLFNQDFDCSK